MQSLQHSAVTNELVQSVDDEVYDSRRAFIYWRRVEEAKKHEWRALAFGKHFDFCSTLKHLLLHEYMLQMVMSCVSEMHIFSQA